MKRRPQSPGHPLTPSFLPSPFLPTRHHLIPLAVFLPEPRSHPHTPSLPSTLILSFPSSPNHVHSFLHFLRPSLNQPPLLCLLPFSSISPVPFFCLLPSHMPPFPLFFPLSPSLPPLPSWPRVCHLLKAAKNCQVRQTRVARRRIWQRPSRFGQTPKVGGRLRKAAAERHGRTRAQEGLLIPRKWREWRCWRRRVDGPFF